MKFEDIEFDEFRLSVVRFNSEEHLKGIYWDVTLFVGIYKDDKFIRDIVYCQFGSYERNYCIEKAIEIMDGFKEPTEKAEPSASNFFVDPRLVILDAKLSEAKDIDKIKSGTKATSDYLNDVNKK